MDVPCAACGEATTESVYRIQRTQRLTCRSCGASIDLSPEQVGLTPTAPSVNGAGT